MSMLKRLPKHMPELPDLLADIFNPSAGELAQAMGVSEATAKRWIAKGEAPKSVMLALFWLTRQGMQWTDADLYNEAQLHFAMNRCQARELREMKAKLRRVSRIGDFGAANDPDRDVPLPVPKAARPVEFRPTQSRQVRRAAPEEAVSVIRGRVCKRPTGFHHFAQRKRRAA